MLDSNSAGQLSGRADCELEQSMLRCLVAGAAMLYVLFLVEWLGQTSALQNALFCLVGFFLLAITLSVRVRTQPGLNPVRRLLGMVADQATAALLMYLLGEYAAPFLFVFLWVSLGNGLRYGRAYLAPAALAGALFMACATYFSPLWADHGWLAAGLVISNLAVPAYMGMFWQRSELGAKSDQKSSELIGLIGLDKVTALPQLPLLTYQVQKAIARCDRSGELIALMWLSVTGLDQARAEHGPSIVHGAIEEIGKRLDRRVRGGDTLARVGNNEFALLLEPVHATDAVRRLAGQLVESIGLVHEIDGRPVHLSAHLGLVFHAGEKMLGRTISAERLLELARCAGDDAGQDPEASGRVVSRFSGTGDKTASVLPLTKCLAA